MTNEDRRHPSHITRSSDASSFDEVCTLCGATDITGGGWGRLALPCKKATAVQIPDSLTTEQRDDLQRIWNDQVRSGKPGADPLWFATAQEIKDCSDSDYYFKISRSTGVPRETVKRVLLAVAYTPPPRDS